MSKTVIKNVESKEQAEGAGARVRRSVGRPEVHFIRFYAVDMWLYILVLS